MNERKRRMMRQEMQGCSDEQAIRMIDRAETASVRDGVNDGENRDKMSEGQRGQRTGEGTVR